MSKLFKLTATFQLTEVAPSRELEPPEDSQEAPSADPVKRDENFNSEILKLMKQAMHGMQGSVTRRFEPPPLSHSFVTEMFDMPAPSIEDALDRLKHVRKSILDFATPAENVGNEPPPIAIAARFS